MAKSEEIILEMKHESDLMRKYQKTLILALIA